MLQSFISVFQYYFLFLKFNCTKLNWKLEIAKKYLLQHYIWFKYNFFNQSIFKYNNTGLNTDVVNLALNDIMFKKHLNINGATVTNCLKKLKVLSVINNFYQCLLKSASKNLFSSCLYINLSLFHSCDSFRMNLELSYKGCKHLEETFWKNCFL